MVEDTMLEMALGDNIRGLRDRIGMSASVMAERLGVSVQAVSQWETGKTKPGQKNRELICDLFGISLEELASRRLPAEANRSQTGGEMVEKTTSIAALRATISILRPDLILDDVQALAAVFLSLALNPPDPASQASFEDQLRARFQGALAARSVEK